MASLRRVAGHIPLTAYILCIVEFAERGSFYGVKQVFSNFVNRKLPVGGNGWGAPPKGTQQTAGALGKGTVVAAAVTSSFGFLVYGLPIFGKCCCHPQTPTFSRTNLVGRWMDC